ncbi:MAG: hypothetical protein IKG21_04345 [Atopobiaceae bacterium]|nr:hypothetical protein [Atopobiaceae bacterium]
MHPVLKYLLTFVGLFAAVVLGTLMLAVTQQRPFVLDLAFAIGVSAAGTVMSFVHDATSER